MPLGWALAGSAVLGYMGSQNQSSAARDAANTQLQGTLAASAQQRQMFDILNQQQAPYREAGYGALNKINTMLPQFTRMPTEQELLDVPGVKFGLEQGTGATGQQMNVSSPGSNVDMARTKFATDYGVNTALPAWRNMQTDIYNRLSNLAGIGQTAQTQSQNLGSATSTNLANLATGGANAIAGGQIGSANAQAGGLQSIGNAGLMYAMLNRPAAVPLSGV